MKELTREQKIENLRMAYSIFWGIPAERIMLNTWRSRDDDMYDIQVTDKQLINQCDTAGCVGGWLSAHPFFKKQGLRYIPNANAIEVKGKEAWKADTILFGEEGDRVFNSGPTGLEGKKLGLQRIRDALYDYNAISHSRWLQLSKREDKLKS